MGDGTPKMGGHMGHDGNHGNMGIGNHDNHNVQHVMQSHGGAHQHGGHSGHHAAYFNFRLNATVLFENWILESRANVFIVCFVAVLLGLGYQGTKWLRQYLHNHYRDRKQTMKSREHLLQTFLYIGELLVSYILMLMVMTYNVWMFIATILSLTIGYFLIGLRRQRGQTCAERCDADCPNLPENQKIDLNLYADVTEQELMPLDSAAREDLCQGCSTTYIDGYDVDGVRETDILT